MGAYTFAGVFDLLGIKQRQIGVYEQYETLAGGEDTNIYTLLRGLIQDFTLPGAMPLRRSDWHYRGDSGAFRLVETSSASSGPSGILRVHHFLPVEFIVHIQRPHSGVGRGCTGSGFPSTPTPSRSRHDPFYCLANDAEQLSRDRRDSLTGLENASKRTQTVLLICVKYGSDPETVQYLESLRKLQGQRDLQVLVVDNNADAGCPELPAESNFTLARAGENLGYFGGARHGLSLYLREHPLPDWVIVSNVDLLIADAQFLDKLALLRARPRLGMVAPSIRSALTGRDQNPFMRKRPSALRMHAYKWIYRSWLAAECCTN